MTLEGHDPGAEETPAPPASTRWSDAAAEDDDVLLPPYVPGAPRPPRGADAVPESEAVEAEVPEPWIEAEAPEPEPEVPEPWGEAEAGEADGGPAAEGAPAADAEEAWSGFPWDGERDSASEEETEPWAAAPEPESAFREPAPADYETAADAGALDPFEGYDFGGREDEDLVDAGAVEELGEPVSGGTGTAGGLPELTEPLTELDPAIPAERLEMLAEILRREGPAGIHREVASRDRLTSLLAGVVAGYLAGLED